MVAAVTDRQRSHVEQPTVLKNGDWPLPVGLWRDNTNVRKSCREKQPDSLDISSVVFLQGLAKSEFTRFCLLRLGLLVEILSRQATRPALRCPECAESRVARGRNDSL